MYSLCVFGGFRMKIRNQCRDLTNSSFSWNTKKHYALRILGMSWGVKTTCFEAPGVSLGGSGVSIGGGDGSLGWELPWICSHLALCWCACIFYPPNGNSGNNWRVLWLGSTKLWVKKTWRASTNWHLVTKDDSEAQILFEHDPPHIGYRRSHFGWQATKWGLRMDKENHHCHDISWWWGGWRGNSKNLNTGISCKENHSLAVL